MRNQVERIALATLIKEINNLKADITSGTFAEFVHRTAEIDFERKRPLSMKNWDIKSPKFLGK